MNKNLLAFIVTISCVVSSSLAQAATDWSAQDYDLYPGDFDGDGKTDVLYIAKDVSRASGIARSDASGPNIPFQSWPANHLGIPWSGNLYKVTVADFNGDGKSDIFLQRSTPGDHYLLFADAQGKITGISQTIGNSHLSLAWSADQHKVLAGDISDDGRADLFLQATTATQASYVLYANSTGLFTTAPTQSLYDGDLGFKWSGTSANVFIGDFNGDGRKDLLVQAKPKIVMVDYDVSIPVPTYPPNLNGVALSQGGATPFQLAYVQQWSRKDKGVDWSPNAVNIVVGNFDGNPGDDILLQARAAGQSSYLMPGHTSGSVITTGTALATNVTWTSDSYRLIAGNFDGTGAAGIYFQALSSGVTNYFANVVTGTSVATTAHDPTSATGVVPATVVGHTVGSFAVSNGGAATYSIPIVVPPGVAGMQPVLSINYQSGSGNGLLGVGWNLGGLSEIERCNKTQAQDNSSDAVSLTSADRFCLDGNKLRLTSGTYGATGSTYQTEIETFSRVTASSTPAGNGPAYFTVETKNGLIYEYGNSSDSRIEAVNAPANSTTPHTWALSKVSDRHGNTMTISYQEDAAPAGSYRPIEILYTSNATVSLAAVYKVSFVWDARPATDVLIAYVAGGVMKETYRLNRIETQYNDPTVGSWRLVRKYQLSYNTSGSTARSRLSAIQECDRGGNCLSPTTFGWQEGVKGWSGIESTSSSSDAMMEYSYPIDFDGDGLDDLVYPQAVSGTTKWHYMKATNGGFDAPVNTGITAGDGTNLQYAKALIIDYYSEGRLSLLVDIPGQSSRKLLRWTGSALALTDTNLTVALTGKEWVADFNGDGRSDFMYATASGGTGYFYVQLNSGATGSQAQFNTAMQFYSTSDSNISPFSSIFSRALLRHFDFNGDGRADIIYSVVTYNCMGSCRYTTVWVPLISTGSAFVAGNSWACLSIGSSCPAGLLVADYNGDGLSDVIGRLGSDWGIRYGSGTGLTAGVAITMPAEFNTGAFTADYDGDGLSDLFYAPSPTSGNWSVLQSTGLGFAAPADTTIPSSSANNTVRVLDVDGDGQRDIGYKSTQFRVRRHNGVVPDFLRSINDGFGNTVTVTYAPLTDSAVYSKGTGAQFPEMDVQGAMYVVKSYSANDGVGDSYTVTQKYAGLRVHLQGRGFLGFASRESIDDRTNIRSRWVFRQDFPFIGLVAESATYQPGGGPLIARMLNTFDQLPVQGAQYQERRFPYIQTGVQTNYEVSDVAGINGQPISSVTTTTPVDSNGNPTTVSAVTADLTTGSGLTYSTTTTNYYEDATCAWRGFTTKQEVTNTVPVFGTQTRTVQFVRDTANAAACRVYQRIIEPTGAADVKVTTTFGYDAFGHAINQAVSAANIQSRTTSTGFGAQGVFPVSVTASVTSTFNQSASKTYDYALGVPKTATDANGLVTSFDYDGFGRLIRLTRPDSTKSEWTYVSCNVSNGYCGDSRLRYQVAKHELDATTPGNVIHSTIQRFDAFGRALYDESQTLSGALSVVATHYDKQGRVSQRSQPYFIGLPVYFTTFDYDLIGRLKQEERRINDAGPGTQTTQYSYNRLVHTQTDANNGITTKRSDAIGQVVEVTDAANGVTTYAYDPFGNLKETTDPASNKVVNAFDIRGFKRSTTDPDMGYWAYTYYPTGELWTQTDAKNQTVTFTYDHLSRPKTRIEPEGTTTYVYGESSVAKNIGKLQSVSSPGSYSESYAYDSLGRLQETTTNADATGFVVTNSFNATTGLLEAVTYPTSTSAVTGSRFKVAYEYEHGLLKRTRDFHSPSTVYWEQVATNAAGQTVDEAYGNGVHTYSAYDGITGLLGERTAGTSSQVQNLSYQWDKLGNLLQRKDDSLHLTEDFVYDSLNRLKTSTLNNVQNLSLTYYANGNIWTKSDVGTYSYPTQGASAVRPHAVMTAGSNSYGYDANGNMTTRSGSSTTWYSYNKPNRIDKGSSYSQFYYGADRSRYKQVAYTAAGGFLPAGTETTIYVGGLFEKVTKPSGAIEYKHYVLAGGEPIAIRTLRTNSANDTRYLHKDHLGSVDVITNETGSVVQRLSYDAFGKRRNATTWAGVLSSGAWSNIAAITHRAFTFHEQLDNVDLVHMNGRVYDPNLGRFISADPFIQAPLMSQSLNRYSYVMNNPLSLIDPSGYSWLSKLFKKAGRLFEKAFGVIGQIVASVVVVAVAIVACWGSQGSGCGPAIAGAAAQLAVIWGGGGSSGGVPARGPPLSGRSSGVDDWIRDHGINGNALDATAGSDTSSILPVPPSDMVDWFAGFGDALTFGLTRYTRDVSGIGSVDTSSGYYKSGHFNGAVAGVLFSVGAAAVAEIAALSRTAAARISGMLDVDLAGVVANGIRGRASEARILKELGLTKNTAAVSTAEGRSIPDALTQSLSVEVKDAASVSLTRQLRIQTEAARAAGRESVLITGERTCVSGACSRAFDTIIRRPDLGPQ